MNWMNKMISWFLLEFHARLMKRQSFLKAAAFISRTQFVARLSTSYLSSPARCLTIDGSEATVDRKVVTGMRKRRRHDLSTITRSPPQRAAMIRWIPMDSSTAIPRLQMAAQGNVVYSFTIRFSWSYASPLLINRSQSHGNIKTSRIFKGTP